jgi:hypothetical protein
VPQMKLFWLRLDAMELDMSGSQCRRRRSAGDAEGRVASATMAFDYGIFQVRSGNGCTTPKVLTIG